MLHLVANWLKFSSAIWVFIYLQSILSILCFSTLVDHCAIKTVELCNLSPRSLTLSLFSSCLFSTQFLQCNVKVLAGFKLDIEGPLQFPISTAECGFMIKCLILSNVAEPLLCFYEILLPFIFIWYYFNCFMFLWYMPFRVTCSGR